MSTTLYRFCQKAVRLIERPGIRHRWIKRGNDPLTAKNLEQKLAEWKAEAEAPHMLRAVNIGFAHARPSRKKTLKERLNHRRSLKNDMAMEKAAKNKELQISLKDVSEEWIATIAPYQIKETADYYGIYKDLFGDAYFLPVIPLDISYRLELNIDSAVQAPIHFGNLVKPFETMNSPKVTYKAKSDELYTLMLTTPDNHFTEEKGEYIHWLIGNIPGNNIEQGQEICDYMQPFPLRGIGYCRYIFVLFKQDNKLDFSEFQRTTPCKNLTARTFSTYDFYRKFEDNMTPAGLAFFQSDWDQTLTKFFHEVLEMKEPSVEYDFDPISLPEQVWFPKGKAFNKYLDKYKDPKELQRELLIEKLKERHPFKPPPTPPKYPLAFHIPPSVPTWLRDDIKNKRMREGKYKFM